MKHLKFLISVLENAVINIYSGNKQNNSIKVSLMFIQLDNIQSLKCYRHFIEGFHCGHTEKYPDSRSFKSVDSGRATEKWIFLTGKSAVIVGVAVVSVELWQDWGQVLHQQEDEAESRHLGFFCSHLERSEAVLITFLCSASDEGNSPKNSIRLKLALREQHLLPFLWLFWALTSIRVVRPSLPKDLFYLARVYLSPLMLMQPLLNRGHRFLPAPFSPAHLAVQLSVRLEVPTLCLHRVCADENDRADHYLNTGCSVEHGKLYQIWMGQTNLFTAPGNLSTLGGFPLGSPRPDLRLSAHTNAGLGWGGAPRELSCHRLLPRPVFTWR